MGKTLYEKVYDAHVVMQKPGELPLLYIDRHIIHEVTSPQAFAGLRAAGRKAPSSRPDARDDGPRHLYPKAHA